MPGVIAAEDAETHPDSNVITRALGFRDDPRPDVVMVPARAGPAPADLLGRAHQGARRRPDPPAPGRGHAGRRDRRAPWSTPRSRRAVATT